MLSVAGDKVCILYVNNGNVKVQFHCRVTTVETNCNTALSLLVDVGM